MKRLFTSGAVLVVLALLVAILQLWFDIWSQSTFAKLELTLGCLSAILLIIWFVRREYEQDKQTRSGQSLD